MNELIMVENGKPILVDGVAKRLVSLETELKALKAESDALKSELIEEMEAHNIVKLETPEVGISYVAPTYRESLDTKAVKAEYPDLYDAYTKVQPVKASLRINVR